MKIEARDALWIILKSCWWTRSCTNVLSSTAAVIKEKGDKPNATIL